MDNGEQKTVLLLTELRIRTKRWMLNKHLNNYPNNYLITVAVRSVKGYVKMYNGGLKTV